MDTNKWYTVKVYWEDSLDGDSSPDDIPVAMFADYNDAKEYASKEIENYKWTTFASVSIWRNGIPYKEYKYSLTD